MYIIITVVYDTQYVSNVIKTKNPLGIVNKVQFFHIAYLL